MANCASLSALDLLEQVHLFEAFGVDLGKAAVVAHFEAALFLPELEVQAAPFQQRAVRALFDQCAVLHDIDLIHWRDRSQAMGDRDHRSPRRQLADRAVDRRFGARIQGGRGFIQHQDRRIAQDGTGNGDALALAAGQPPARLAHVGIVSVRQGHDEVVYLGLTGSRFDFRIACLRLRQPDVLADGGVEQEVVLEDDTHLSAQRVLRRRGDVMAIEGDAAALRVV